jgi:hypothetical protein
MEERRQGDKGKGHAVETLVNLFEVSPAENGMHLCHQPITVSQSRATTPLCLFRKGKRAQRLNLELMRAALTKFKTMATWMG